MAIGAEMLLSKFGTRLAVAEALLLGDKYVDLYAEHVGELVSPIILDAAKWRLEHPDLVSANTTGGGKLMADVVIQVEFLGDSLLVRPPQTLALSRVPSVGEYVEVESGEAHEVVVVRHKPRRGQTGAAVDAVARVKDCR